MKQENTVYLMFTLMNFIVFFTNTHFLNVKQTTHSKKGGTEKCLKDDVTVLPTVSMPIAHSLKTCNICGIVICDNYN